MNGRRSIQALCLALVARSVAFAEVRELFVPAEEVATGSTTNEAEFAQQNPGLVGTCGVLRLTRVDDQVSDLSAARKVLASGASSEILWLGIEGEDDLPRAAVFGVALDCPVVSRVCRGEEVWATFDFTVPVWSRAPIVVRDADADSPACGARWFSPAPNSELTLHLEAKCLLPGARLVTRKETEREPRLRRDWKTLYSQVAPRILGATVKATRSSETPATTEAPACPENATLRNLVESSGTWTPIPCASEVLRLAERSADVEVAFEGREAPVREAATALALEPTPGECAAEKEALARVAWEMVAQCASFEGSRLAETRVRRSSARSDKESIDRCRPVLSAPGVAALAGDLARSLEAAELTIADRACKEKDGVVSSGIAGSFVPCSTALARRRDAEGRLWLLESLAELNVQCAGTWTSPASAGAGSKQESAFREKSCAHLGRAVAERAEAIARLPRHTLSTRLITGPRELLSLSANAVVTEFDQVEYDSAAGTLVTKGQPGRIFIGLDLSFSDLAQERRHRFGLKFLVSPSKTPFDAFGLALEYEGGGRFLRAVNPFVGIAWSRDDAGKDDRDSKLEAQLVAGLGFKLERLTSWIKHPDKKK